MKKSSRATLTMFCAIGISTLGMAAPAMADTVHGDTNPGVSNGCKNDRPEEKNPHCQPKEEQAPEAPATVLDLSDADRGPVLTTGADNKPDFPIGYQSSFVAGEAPATVLDLSDADRGPVLTTGSRPEVVGQVTGAFTGQTTVVPATPLTPATASMPATALTPANTISIPVEVPGTATTSARPESARPSRSNTGTEPKNTGEAHDGTAEQLAHTGADETAALAALALALMGTGITLVGFKRRQTA